MKAAARPLDILGDKAGLVFDVVLELTSEMLDEALDRESRCVAERTDGATRNIAEHACTPTGPGDPFSHARTTRARSPQL